MLFPLVLILYEKKKKKKNLKSFNNNLLVIYKNAPDLPNLQKTTSSPYVRQYGNFYDIS